MTLANKFKNICLSLGNNNNPAYAVMAIATVKGICRPLFTMMDKTEKPETKKYTALREGLTEAIAIPTYWATATLAGKMSKLIKDETAQGIAKKNLLFLGVCTAALFVIPAVCSVAIKPFMKFIQKKGQENNPQAEETKKLDTGSTNELQNLKTIPTEQVVAPPYVMGKTPAMANFATPKIQPAMKVGAV